MPDFIPAALGADLDGHGQAPMTGAPAFSIAALKFQAAAIREASLGRPQTPSEDLLRSTRWGGEELQHPGRG